MLEKPTLSDEKIITALDEGFGIIGMSIEFLPIGNDATSWAYRVMAENEKSYFLKVKKGLPDLRGIVTPRFLHEQGLKLVIAPLPARNRIPLQETEISNQGRNWIQSDRKESPTAMLPLKLWYHAGEYSLILFPFTNGNNGMKVGLTEALWVEYGTFLQNLHTIQLPSELLKVIPRETFVSKWLEIVQKIKERLKERNLTDPFQQKLAAFWEEYDDQIQQIVHRTVELGKVLQSQPLEFVLCHADIHTANILITPDEKMFVVDWDESILAPRERDIMFIIGIPTEQEALFFQGYGTLDINWTALAYYRYEWVVQEIGDYGARVFLMDSVGETTKRDAVEGFLSLFQPGDVVEAAYKSEEKLR